MKQTIFDKGALKVIAVIWLVAIAVSGFKIIRDQETKCIDVKVDISTPNVIENTPFTVSGIAPGVKNWHWDFGDSTKIETASKVAHTYAVAGTYKLKLTVNGNDRCPITRDITVSQDMSAAAVSSSGTSIATSIEGPSTAMVGKPVKFHETSGKATSWAWTSSDSKGIDGTGQEVTYTFATPGPKTVYVSINGNKGKASIDVTVSSPAGGGKGAAASKPKITEDVFRAMLNEVVNKKKDVPAFSDALCGNLKMVVNYKLKGKPGQMTFDDFCKDIRGHGYRTEFDQIKLTYDSKGCITSIEIMMHKGSSRLMVDR